MTEFTVKDWRNATTHEGGGDTSTPLSAIALEDAETRLSEHATGLWWEVIYADDYGAVGDGATDDTDALQAAIDAALALGGDVEVRLEPGKTYLVNEAPRTDKGGYSILSISHAPGDYAHHNDKIAIVAGTRTFAGYLYAATIKTTRTGDTYSATYGPPSVLGGATDENAGVNVAWTGAIALRGITVQVPEDSEIAGIDAIGWGGADFDNVYVISGDGNSMVNPPSYPHAFGIRSPTNANNWVPRFRNTQVFQMYAGLVLVAPDHSRLDGVVAHHCNLGLAFQDSDLLGGHTVAGDYFMANHCEYVIAGWDATTGVKSLSASGGVAHIQNLNVVVELVPTSIIEDENNMIHSDRLSIHYYSGLAVATPPASLFNGAQNCRMTQPQKEASRVIPDVVSASTIDLQPTIDAYNITGTTAIDHIQLAWPGKRITLFWAAYAPNTASINHNAATPPAGYGPAILWKQKTFQRAAGVAEALSITLICDGTAWYEVGRSGSWNDYYAYGFSDAHNVMIDGDAEPRYSLSASGIQSWSNGTDAADANQYRSGVGKVKTDGKYIAAAGIGVGNSGTASTPGTVTKKMEVFDGSGNSLGFVAIYNAIT